jgi:hypothetical protein
LIKKITALLLAFSLCLALSSCSLFQADEAVISVSGADIDKEIFAYYLDKVKARPSDYGLDEKADASDYADKAVELCTRYVTVNTMFAKYNLKLTNSQKFSIADNVSNKWTCYSNHYKKIGVSRATISKIVTNETYENTIFTTLFDNSDEEAEKKVRKYFAENYIIFRAVCGYFVTTDAAGSAIEMSDAEKDKVEAKFRSLAEKIVDISGLETAANELSYTASSAILLKKTQCEGYPDGFFEDVNSLQNDSASVLRYDDCIFIIWKYNPDDREEEYASCRSQCVKDMYSAFGEASFRSIEETFQVTRSEAMINSFIKNIEIYG